MSLTIAKIIEFVAGRLAAGEAFTEFTKDFSDATVAWLRPLFLTEEGEEREAVSQLRERPESEARRRGLAARLEAAREDDPGGTDAQLEAMLRTIRELQPGPEPGPRSVQVTNSRNVNTAPIDSGGGDVTIGDDNSLNR